MLIIKLQLTGPCNEARPGAGLGLSAIVTAPLHLGATGGWSVGKITHRIIVTCSVAAYNFLKMAQCEYDI